MTDQQPGSFPLGLVTFLSTPSPQIPAGWEQYQAGQGRLLLAAPTESDIGHAAGTPVASQQVPTHTHSHAGAVSVPSYATATVGGGDEGVAQSGSQPADGSLSAHDTGLGFLHMQIVRSLGSGPAGAGDPLPYGAVAFFDRPPPAGWSARYDWGGHFVLPSSGDTVLLGDPWDPTTPAQHSHTVSGDFEMNAAGFTWGGGADGNTADAAPAWYAGATENGTDPSVPFITLLLCEKTDMASPGRIPAGLTIFVAAQNPPDGWGLVPGSQQRFLVGLPSGGEIGFAGGPAVGATASHAHVGTGSVTIPNYNTDLASGIQDFNLGTHGDYTFAVSASAQDLTLPALTLLHCAYWGGADAH